ncbi:MAG: hypothetical protein ACRDN6_02860 [Gaiellaceae bacterium]
MELEARGERRAVSPIDLAAAGLALAAAVASSFLVLEGESWWTIWLLFAPVAVACAPLVVAGRARRAARIVAAVLLSLWCLLALASVGIFYVPSAVATVAAAVRARRSRRRA